MGHNFAGGGGTDGGSNFGGHPDQSASWSQGMQSGQSPGLFGGKPLTKVPPRTFTPIVIALIIFTIMVIPFVIDWSGVEPGRQEEDANRMGLSGQEANPEAAGDVSYGNTTDAAAGAMATQGVESQTAGAMGGQAPGQFPAQFPNQVGQSYAPAPSQTYGQSYGQSYGQNLGQSFGQNPAQSFGQNLGQSFGQTYGSQGGQFPGRAMQDSSHPAFQQQPIHKFKVYVNR
ncbi:MAG: hypothetical protein K2Y32_16070 [Candidatus Obscuribacterales bacterium]|nr:hypothetical protein [Candidatus Obscuribacterales bacterium]